MSNRRGYTLAVIVLVSITFVLAACQGQPAATPAPVQAPAKTTAAPAAATTAAPAPAQTSAAATTAAQASAAPAGTVKLGYALSLTGPIVRVSTALGRFYDMAVEEVNSKGGVKIGDKTYKLESVTADAKYTSEGGRSAADNLVLAQKVKFVLPDAQAPTAGAQAATDPNKVLLVPMSAVDASLGKEHPLALQIGSPHNRMRVPALYEWLLKSQPQAKNVVLIVQNDVNGKSYEGISQEAAKDKGLNMVAIERFSMDIKDFSPLILRVLSNKNIDAIDVATIGASGPIFESLMKALYEQGWRKPVLGHGMNVGALQNLGVMGENYVFSTLVDWKSDLMSAKEKQIYAAYVQKYGESELETMAINGYSAPLVLAQAMTKAGTVDDTGKLADVMRAGTWETIFGQGRFVGAKAFGLPAVLEVTTYIGTSKGGKLVNFDKVKGTME